MGAIQNTDGSFSVVGPSGNYMFRSAIDPTLAATPTTSAPAPAEDKYVFGGAYKPGLLGGSAFPVTDLRTPEVKAPDASKVAKNAAEDPSTWGPAGQALAARFVNTVGIPEPMSPAEKAKFDTSTGGSPGAVGHASAPQAPRKIDPSAGVFAQPQAPSGPRIIQGKAGWADKSRSVQEVSYRPEDQDLVTEAFKRKAEAEQALAIVGARQADDEAAVRNAYAQRLEQHNADVAQRELARQQAMDAQIGKLRQASDEAAAGKIDRDAVWGGSQAAKVSAGIGIALGAMAQAWGAGDNVGIRIVNKAIDDSIAEQKANIENKRASAQAQSSILGQMRETFGDQRTAELATKQILLENAMAQIEARKAGNASGAIKAKADQAVADLRTEWAKTNAEFNKSHLSTNQVWDNGVRVVGGAGSDPKMQSEVRAIAEKMKEHAAGAAALRELYSVFDTTNNEAPAGFTAANAIPGVQAGRTVLSWMGNENAQKGKENQQRVKTLYGPAIKVLGLPERQAEEMGERLFNAESAGQAMQTVKTMSNLHNDSVRNALAGYSPAAVQEYLRQSGQNPIVSPPARVKKAGGPVAPAEGG